ncbi:MAG: UDP-2,3-diacylglucosamine diphosphatase [Cycloclasticus sp. symbiont of Bathymodiolus heckerae]|nr:MAG: UDP-2,3-diacylglucosamine diphosphatase [Cycloclasticus sp. symbiont of Bathymodiolus heckerae]
MNQHIHFISDLHLTQDRPENTQRFLAYIEALGSDVSDLYILGDLFDVWVGDDDPTPPNNIVKEKLSDLTAKGTQVHFLAGNRDFLIGQEFFNTTGVTCLEDEVVIDLFGTQTLLMHGDLLCTDDVEYQQFRRLTHNPAWQKEALSKPLKERLALAQHYRQESHLNKKEKSAGIMDVNEATVVSALEKHNVKQLIHGHTHRPNIHDHTVNTQSAKRFVLAEWANSGSVLDWTEKGYDVIELA